MGRKNWLRLGFAVMCFAGIALMDVLVLRGDPDRLFDHPAAWVGFAGMLLGGMGFTRLMPRDEITRTGRGVREISEAETLDDDFEGTIVVTASGSLTMNGDHEGALVVYGAVLIAGTHVGALQIFPGGTARIAPGGRQIGEVNAEGSFTDESSTV